MGISFSSVLDENERRSNVHAIHELYSLERKVCQKLEEQSSKLYINALNDECVPIVCAVDKKQRLLLKVDSASSEEIRKRIKEVLEGDYLEELVTLLTEKLSNVLRDTKTGDHENLYTHVVFANKSVVRIDLFVYHRWFSPTESLREYHNILAYYMQVGLVDMAKARPQVLIYELSRATDSGKVNDACEKIEARAKCTQRLNYTLEHIAKSGIGCIRLAPDEENLDSAGIPHYIAGTHSHFLRCLDKLKAWKLSLIGRKPLNDNLPG